MRQQHPNAPRICYHQDFCTVGLSLLGVNLSLMLTQRAQEKAALIRGSQMKPGAWPQPSGTLYFLLETTSFILTITVNLLLCWTWTFHQKIPQNVIFTVIIQTRHRSENREVCFASQTCFYYAEPRRGLLWAQHTRWVYPRLTGIFSLSTFFRAYSGSALFLSVSTSPHR